MTRFIARHRARLTELDQLRRDHRHEVRLLAKGVLALLVTAAVIVIRQRYLL
jgi:hypothetical protein